MRELRWKRLGVEAKRFSANSVYFEVDATEATTPACACHGLRLPGNNLWLSSDPKPIPVRSCGPLTYALWQAPAGSLMRLCLCRSAGLTNPPGPPRFMDPWPADLWPILLLDSTRKLLFTTLNSYRQAPSARFMYVVVREMHQRSAIQEGAGLLVLPSGSRAETVNLGISGIRKAAVNCQVLAALQMARGLY